MNDQQLLREYTADGSEAAFAELYRRHAGWVGGVARRLAGDEELARDITQAVFLVLAQRARHIKAEAALNAWLFETTRRTTKTALRLEARRKRREREVAMMHRVNSPTDDVLWPQLASDLDGLVHKLRSTDRDAILLRFYQHKTHEQ